MMLSDFQLRQESDDEICEILTANIRKIKDAMSLIDRITTYVGRNRSESLMLDTLRTIRTAPSMSKDKWTGNVLRMEKMQSASWDGSLEGDVVWTDVGGGERKSHLKRIAKDLKEASAGVSTASQREQCKIGKFPLKKRRTRGCVFVSTKTESSSEEKEESKESKKKRMPVEQSDTAKKPVEHSMVSDCQPQESLSEQEMLQRDRELLEAYVAKYGNDVPDEGDKTVVNCIKNSCAVIRKYSPCEN